MLRRILVVCWLLMILSHPTVAAEVAVIEPRRFDNLNNGTIDLDIAMGSNMDDQTGMVCNIRLKGEIEPGDAAKIKTAVARISPQAFVDTPRLCLDSEGGSYSEGLAIVEMLSTVRVGTGLEPNATCLSACAIAFMGGYYPWKGVLNRIMHPTSTLAFHSPNLPGPSLQTDKQQVIARSYAEGIKAVKRLVELGRNNVPHFFPNELLDQMLAKGPDEMYAVDTVGKVIRYRIFLYGARRPIFSDAEFCNACTNHYYGALEEYGARGQYRHCLDVVAKPQKKTFPKGTRLTYDAAAPRGGDCVIDLMQAGGKLTNWYFHTDLSSLNRFGTDGGAMEFAYWYLYPPDTPLRSIAERR